MSQLFFIKNTTLLVFFGFLVLGFVGVPFTSAMSQQVSASTESPLTTGTVFADGVANTGFIESLGNTYQVTISTAHANDLIVVVMIFYNTITVTAQSKVVSISDTAGHHWTTISNHLNSQGHVIQPAIFVTHSRSVLSSDQITLVTGKDSSQYQLTAFAINGVKSFDNSTSLPKIVENTGPIASLKFATTSGGEVALAYLATNHGADIVSYPSKYTPITTETNGQWFYVAFKVFGISTTHPSFSWNLSPSDTYAVLGDAMVLG